MKNCASSWLFTMIIIEDSDLPSFYGHGTSKFVHLLILYWFFSLKDCCTEQDKVLNIYTLWEVLNIQSMK